MPAPYAAALEAFRTASVWCRMPAYAFLSVQGKGRAGFLHGLLSADIKGMEVGTGRPACLLTAKGALVAPLGVHHLPDEHLLVGPVEAVHKAFELLTKMAPLSDCKVGVHDMAAWLVAGPKRAQVLEAISGRPNDPGPGGVRAFATSAGTVGVLTDFHTGLEAYLLIVPKSAAERFEGILKDGVELPAAALEALRVERGMPAWGVEAGPENFPQEVGLDSWVSHDKGCYLGQEMMARLRDRGHVNKVLVALRFAEPVAVGDPLEGADGLSVGKVTSIAPSEAGVVGLAVVRREALGASLIARAGAKRVPAEMR